MYISNENASQTEKRLISVLKAARLQILKEPYYFKETSITEFSFHPKALAMVRDSEVWSYLVPAEKKGTENFKIFSFHFKNEQDNSGFVGWLASTIKAKLGSGVFVVCGQNTNKGGIFDYWGCPIEISDQVLQFINDLREV